VSTSSNPNFSEHGERVGELTPAETFLEGLPSAQRASQALANLRKVDHIVVLVLENRSFDHMLGYLSLPAELRGRGRTEVNGLTGHEFNLRPGYLTADTAGTAGTEADPRRRKVFRLAQTRFPVDPGHGAGSVAMQIGNNDRDPAMGGFVRNFDQVLRDEKDAGNLDPGLIMGYHTGDQLPAYDLISEHFAVCDRWFSSMPGPTWPNRMFLYCGTSNGIAGNPKSIANYGPAYDAMPERTVLDVLDDHKVDWRIFSHDFAWMRFFRSFDPGPIPAFSRVDKFNRFLDRCAEDKLPSVSFIDPNWRDIPNGAPSDDHPPEAAVGDGQRLVARVYEALRTGANNLFKRALLVVTYDEHGGFFDHVLPPLARDHRTGDPASLKTYGVRVPALVVSPWVPKRSVSHTLFDHTSILKTILLRFCGQAAIGSLERQGRRVAAAAHLGELLTEGSARGNLPSAASLARVIERASAMPGGGRSGRDSDLVSQIEAGRAAAMARGVPEEHL